MFFLLLLAGFVSSSGFAISGSALEADRSCEDAEGIGLLQSKVGAYSGSKAGAHSGRSSRVLHPPTLSQENVSQELPQDLHWGVYIDGRDASKGQNAYGLNFSQDMEAALKEVHSFPADLETYEVFLKIKTLLKSEYRHGMDNPPLNEHRMNCMETHVPSSYQKAIFQNTMVDRMKAENEKGRAGDEVEELLADIFREYDKKIAESSTEDEKYLSVAILLRNLAWLHPFEDRNSRSRVLLLQSELRRLGLAGGAFLFNNGQNIYYDSEDTWIAKLKEGVEMYKLAMNDRQNPWLDSSKISQHLEKYKRDFDESLMTCLNRGLDSIDEKGKTPL
eukprot:TRINITY_DN1407_c4_g1_i1.p1 TRINITY_DN1407_c4_g1~~TRINITY_DN1407_c4_g1_i1.p1  ORF type:complete len:352 (+),score=70.74 TRINITY_DN1407_c4_g1_i1:60-1058(+)